MSSFKVLKYNEIFMTWVGIRARQFTEQTNGFFTPILHLYILVLVVIFTISSIIYFFMAWPKFESQSCIAILCCFQVLGMLTTLALKMNTIKAVHLGLQHVVDEEDPKGEAFQMYQRIEELCRKITKTIAMYIPMNQVMTFASLFYSFYSISIGGLDTTEWGLPFKLVVPFNTKIIWKWYILWIFNLKITITYGTVVTLIPSHFICFCLYICGICDHFNLLLQTIQKDLERDRNKATLSDLKIDAKIHKVIRIQIKVFEIFKLVADINSGIIFSLLPINVFFLALTMYSIEFLTFDVVSFLYLLVCISCSFTWPLAFCYFSSLTTDRIANLSQNVYNANWFDYPLKIQKNVILIIIRSQEPVHFSGFSIVQCTLESFGNILKSAVSYYMIFRGLSQR